MDTHSPAIGKHITCFSNWEILAIEGYSLVQSCLTRNTSVSLPPTILVVFFIPHLHVPVQEFSFEAVCKVESLKWGKKSENWNNSVLKKVPVTIILKTQILRTSTQKHSAWINERFLQTSCLLSNLNLKSVTACGLWLFCEDYVKNKGDVLDFSFTSVLDMPLWIRLQAAI